MVNGLLSKITINLFFHELDKCINFQMPVEIVEKCSLRICKVNLEKTKIEYFYIGQNLKLTSRIKRTLHFFINKTCMEFAHRYSNKNCYHSN